MARELRTYIVYYCDSNDEANGWEVYGIKQLRDAMKWLRSIKATSIEIYKYGPNFENDQDDVIACYKEFWKIPVAEMEAARKRKKPSGGGNHN